MRKKTLCDAKMRSRKASGVCVGFATRSTVGVCAIEYSWQVACTAWCIRTRPLLLEAYARKVSCCGKAKRPYPIEYDVWNLDSYHAMKRSCSLMKPHFLRNVLCISIAFSLLITSVQLPLRQAEAFVPAAAPVVAPVVVPLFTKVVNTLVLIGMYSMVSKAMSTG